MPGDQNTYGFNRRDAEALIATIGSVETETPERRNRGGGGSLAVKLVQTPGGGIAARSGTTVGSATCTEVKITSGTTLATNTNTVTVKNIWPFAIPASMYILAVREHISSHWVAMHPGVTNVRWDSPDLEQTWDGSSYSNIDTAEVCT